MRTRYPKGSTWQVLCLADDLSRPWVERARSSEIVALGTGRSLSLLHVSYLFPLIAPISLASMVLVLNQPFGASIIRSSFSVKTPWYFCRLYFGTRFTRRRAWCNQKCQVEASFGSASGISPPQKPCRYPQGFHIGIPPPLLAQLLERCFMFVSNWRSPPLTPSICQSDVI